MIRGRMTPIPFPFVAVAAVPLLAVGVWVVLCHARRPVQVYVGEDEQSMSRDLSGARRRGARGPKASAQRGLRRPAQSPPSTDCRGSARVSDISQRCGSSASRPAALPLHFRLLRRLGIECRVATTERNMSDGTILEVHRLAPAASAREE